MCTLLRNKHYTMKINITDLNEEDRPREKFEAHGASALSKAELLAILIGSGNAEENAVQLMQRLMQDCDNSLAALGRMNVKELCQYKGMGPAKAITILAACELGKRRMNEVPQRKLIFNSPDIIYEYFKSKLRDYTVEECHVLLLNQSLRLLQDKLVSRGGMTGTVVDIRLILKDALLAGATHLVLCHNHPSGNCRPSREDDLLTSRLQKAAETMDIRLIDHLVFTDNGYYSYQNEGKI